MSGTCHLTGSLPIIFALHEYISNRFKELRSKDIIILTHIIKRIKWIISNTKYKKMIKINL